MGKLSLFSASPTVYGEYHIMKINKSFALMAVAAIASASVASASPVAPAAQAPAPAAKIALPVVAGVQSLSKSEKAGVSGEGLVTLNVLNGSSLLNGTSLLNNLNLLNIGSFNSWRSGGSNNCGCGNS